MTLIEIPLDKQLDIVNTNQYTYVGKISINTAHRLVAGVCWQRHACNYEEADKEEPELKVITKRVERLMDGCANEMRDCGERNSSLIAFG